MWHVRFSEKDVRRGTLEQLQGLVAKGRILPATLVRAPNANQWVKAESVSDLFPTQEAGLVLLEDDDPLASMAALESSGGLASHNPLGTPAPLGRPAALAGDDSDKKLLIIAGSVGGGALVILILAIVIMSAMGSSSDVPIAAVDTTPAAATETLMPEVPATTPTVTPASVTPTAETSTAPAPAAAPPPATTAAAPPAAIAETSASTSAAPPPVTSAAPPPVTSAAPAAVTPAVEMTLTDLIAKVQPSIVRVDVRTQLGGGVGSGFVVDDQGTVVTNLHVVAGAKSGRLTFADKTEVDIASLVAVSKEQDLAILRFDPTKAKSVPLPLSPQLPSAGERVAAFGAPQGLSFTTSDGIVSAVRTGDDLRQFGAEFSATLVQTSAPISPGNSGGPLVNMKGQVVGVNTVQITTGQNLNFAVSCMDVRELLEKSKGATLSLADLEKYEPQKSEKLSFKEIEKQQMEALKVPDPVEEEWIIGGQPVKATLVSIVSTEKEPRGPHQIRSTDFPRGKYVNPRGLKVKLRLEDGTEKEFSLTQFGTASIQRARDYWHAQAYASIKKKLVTRGNDRIQALYEAALGGDGESVARLAGSVAMIYAFADAALPQNEASHVRKLVGMNLDLMITDGYQDKMKRILADMEASFRAKVKSTPELQQAYSGFLQEMLAQDDG